MKWMHDEGTRNMLADIERADPFDGVPADVTADPIHGGRGGTMGDAAASMPPHEEPRGPSVVERAHTVGRVQGIFDVVDWLRANEYPAAAQAVSINMMDIEEAIRTKARNGR